MRQQTKKTFTRQRGSRWALALGAALVIQSPYTMALSTAPESKELEPVSFTGQAFSSQLESVLKPIRHAQNGRDKDRENFRSRSEVVREIKQRYDAKVLKISLNEARAVYDVRVLMPNGKVRNMQVSARR